MQLVLAYNRGQYFVVDWKRRPLREVDFAECLRPYTRWVKVGMVSDSSFSFNPFARIPKCGPFLVFDFRALALNPECQSARKSKPKSCRLASLASNAWISVQCSYGLISTWSVVSQLRLGSCVQLQQLCSTTFSQNIIMLTIEIN